MGWVEYLCCHGNHRDTDQSCWTPASTGAQSEEGGEELTLKTHAAITALPPSLL